MKRTFKEECMDIFQTYWWIPGVIPIEILCEAFPKLQTPWQLYCILIPIAMSLTMLLLCIQPIIIGGWIAWMLVSLPFATCKWIRDLKKVDKSQ